MSLKDLKKSFRLAKKNVLTSNDPARPDSVVRYMDAISKKDSPLNTPVGKWLEITGGMESAKWIAYFTGTVGTSFPKNDKNYQYVVHEIKKYLENIEIHEMDILLSKFEMRLREHPSHTQMSTTLTKYLYRQEGMLTELNLFFLYVVSFLPAQNPGLLIKTIQKLFRKYDVSAFNKSIDLLFTFFILDRTAKQLDKYTIHNIVMFDLLIQTKKELIKVDSFDVLFK